MTELTESEKYEIADAYFNISDDKANEYLSVGSTNIDTQEVSSFVSTGVVSEFYSGDDTHDLEGESCISINFEQVHKEDGHPSRNESCTSYLTKREAAQLMASLYETILTYEEMDDV